MKLLSALVLLLPCLVLCNYTKLTPCNLVGYWKNELGSVMKITAAKGNGAFSGTYMTAVTTSTMAVGESPVIGYQQSKEHSIFGFTVKWESTGSITVFTGQCFRTATGKQALYTIWLLRSESQNEHDNWSHTNIGSDIFEFQEQTPTIQQFPEN